MRKSPKSRPSLTALTAGLSTCVGLGCASAQRPEEPLPPPISCPDGSGQTYELHHVTQMYTVVRFEESPEGDGIVRKGEALQVQLNKAWGDVPKSTPLVGRMWFGRDRVYGRLTQLLLPGGVSLPICLDLLFNEPGVPLHPGSTRTVAHVPRVADAGIARESLNP